MNRFKDIIKPVIVAIAKQEKDYIEEWVRWHIAIGFDHIYLYDNEDVPTYKQHLERYHQYLTVVHMPRNNFVKGVQYLAVDHFKHHFMNSNNNTHVSHIDIDEFIVLQKSFNIKEFIDQFLVGDCGAVCMNWRLFGDSYHKTDDIDQSVITRFTHRQKKGDKLFKSLWKISAFKYMKNVHCVSLKEPYKTKNTNNHIVPGTYNRKLHFDFIQINHYRSKTFNEFCRRLSILRADRPKAKQSTKKVADFTYIKKRFDKLNRNEEQDLTALNYIPIVDNFWKNYFTD
jgi:hypothetical protein